MIILYTVFTIEVPKEFIREMFSVKIVCSEFFAHGAWVSGFHFTAAAIWEDYLNFKYKTNAIT